MATTYKTLGQSAPSATTSTDLYTVPALTSAIGSTLVVANRGTAITTFRVSVSLLGAALATKDYLIYDASLSGNTSATFTIGLTLATTDKVRVYASTADLSFNLFGTEIS